MLYHAMARSDMGPLMFTFTNSQAVRNTVY